MGSERFTCNLCEAMCGLRVTIEEGRVKQIAGDPDDVFSKGHICPKANALRELADDPDRLRGPVCRTETGWEPISWDEALARVAKKLRGIRAAHGRDAVALYVGNPTVHGHRASLGSQLLTAALGTQNRFDPNSQDSNPRLFACMQVYGDALSLPVPDIERTDHLLMLGANPAASNGSMLALGDVRKRMQAIRGRGGKVVVVDPRRTETAEWCTNHHFIRPGGDAALLAAMLHVLFAQRLVDRVALRRSASGIGALEALVRGFSPECVAPAIGMDASVIRQLARELAAAKSACIYGRVGICQNEFGPVASWLIEALNVVTGNFDREGGAMFPTPPVDVAPLGRLVVGNHWGRWRSRVRGLPEFLGALPSSVISEEIETPGEGQIRALVCFAGNPVLSTPNGPRLDRALEKLDFMVAIDFYVNETTRHADIILPPKHVFETGNFDLILSRFTVRNVAKYSPPILETTDDTRDDWEILSDLSARIVGPEIGFVQSAWRALAKRAPELLVDLLLRTGPHRLKLAELRPTGTDLGPLVPSRRERVHTTDGRVRLAPAVLAADMPRVEKWVDEKARAELVLIGRRHLRSNNSWMHNARSLVKGPDRAKLMMHPRDAGRLGLRDGANVRVRSRVGEVTTLLSITDDVMFGVVSLPHGYGHQIAASTLAIAGALPGASANALTDEQRVEPIIGTSILNGVPVNVELA